MSSKMLACTAAAVFSFLSGVAKAAVVTFQFVGAVTYGGPMAVAVGTPIVGMFSYDTSASPSIAIRAYADYQILPPFTMSATVGGHVITTAMMSVDIWKHSNGNVEDLVSVTGGHSMVFGRDNVSGWGVELIVGQRATYQRHNYDQAPVLLQRQRVQRMAQRFSASRRGQTGQLLQFSIDSIVVIQTAP